MEMWAGSYSEMPYILFEKWLKTKNKLCFLTNLPVLVLHHV